MVRLRKEPDHFNKVDRKRPTPMAKLTVQERREVIQALYLAATSLDEEIKSFLPPRRAMWDDGDRAKYADWNRQRLRYRKLRARLLEQEKQENAATPRKSRSGA